MTISDDIARREMRDRHAARILESSALIRIVDRALSLLERAARTATVAAWARRGFTSWNQWPVGHRRFMSGVTCVTAALVHLALTLVGNTPPAWLWMVPPAIVLAIGVTLIAASADDSRASG